MNPEQIKMAGERLANQYNATLSGYTEEKDEQTGMNVIVFNCVLENGNEILIHISEQKLAEYIYGIDNKPTKVSVKEIVYEQLIRAYKEREENEGFKMLGESMPKDDPESAYALRINDFALNQVNDAIVFLEGILAEMNGVSNAN